MLINFQALILLLKQNNMTDTELMIELYSAFKSGDIDYARELAEQYPDLVEFIMGKLSKPLQELL